MAKRSAKVIADDIDVLCAGLPGGARRQMQRLLAELRGEELEPTENEVRAAERTKEITEQAEAAEEAAAEKAAAEKAALTM